MLLLCGFTHCPDLCPTTMADMARVVDKQSIDGQHVQGLFVTVDSDRDMPQALTKYVTGFHPSFLGLLGTEGKTETLARKFNIFYAAQPADSHEHNMIIHSNAIFVFDPRGRLRLLMGGNRTIDAMAADIALLLKK